MKKITQKLYLLSPDRYELRRGTTPDAPDCPYGNRYAWIGFDKKEQEYVRFTKSVFKKLVREIEGE